MKGMEGERLQRRGAEDGLVRSGERTTDVYEKAAGLQSYVNEFMRNNAQVDSLIGLRFAQKINGNRSAAETFARENDFLIPKDVKELGMDHQTAFVLQLAEELSKPEYNQ